MAEPSILQDMKKVAWPKTLVAIFLRSVFAGLFWASVLRFGGDMKIADALIAGPAIVGTWTIIGLVSAGLASLGVPLIGLFSWLAILLVLPGDPPLWLIVKAKPELLGMTGYKFLNALLIPCVMKSGITENEAETAESDEEQG